MLSVIRSCAIAGIDAFPITVEVDITAGLPGFAMVGLPDSAVKESRDRVFSALKNSGFSVPSRRITINLAPGGVRKEGTAFDLPLALGILLASEQVRFPEAEGLLFMGELSLDGGLRPVRGALPAALHARQEGLQGLVLPSENGEEAALVKGVKLYAAGSLLEALELLKDGTPRAATPRPRPPRPATALDLSDVKGQSGARRALEVAAAGGHNFVLVGSPGCGKTLLARRLPTILPALTEEESLETTRIYSVAGLLKPGRALVGDRPFRAPHHSISDQALIGGGPLPRPGEISLAHNGVLFMDEFPEFRRSATEALRQPLEEGTVSISRASRAVTFPCRVVLAAAMNPCPCGRLMDVRRSCRCRVEEIVRYRDRISGPLLDRIDIHLEMPALNFGEMGAGRAPEGSAAVRARVEGARALQAERFKGSPRFAGVHCNAHMPAGALKDLCPLGPGPQRLLRDAVERMGLSARAHDRLIKVARTCADLDGRGEISEQNVLEAILYRSLDRKVDPFA